MTLAFAVDVGLALLVLAVAGWSLAVRAAFAAVISFVAYGLLLALVWVRLAAPDVAGFKKIIAEAEKTKAKAHAKANEGAK